MKTSDPRDEYVGWTVERMLRDAMKRFYSRCWCSMDGKRFIWQPVVAFSKWKRPFQIYLAHCLLNPTRYFLKNSYDSYLVSSLTNANFHFLLKSDFRSFHENLILHNNNSNIETKKLQVAFVTFWAHTLIFLTNK